MKRVTALLIAALLLIATLPALAEQSALEYRFADAGEAATLLLSNRDYYENLTQVDIDFRLQRTGGTLEELEALAAGQTRDFTDAEKAAVDDAMAFIEATCAQRGYALPPTDGIVFCKTTMAEEGVGAAGYTHGTQICLGEDALACGMAAEADARAWFRCLIAHELFHCLTRNHPGFRAAMYAILGFTVADEDCAFPEAIRRRIISNPDVDHHNAHAAFVIGGEARECVVVFTSAKTFEKPGDTFFDDMVTGLVPIDDPGTMYTSEEAENFWDVFGENTDYVIDPEETLADNFAFTLIYGADGRDYPSPQIIKAIDACLKRPAE